MPNDLDRHTIGHFLQSQGAEAWGVAANEPALPLAPDLPRALSVMMRIDPGVLRGMRHGPTAQYRAEYRRLNRSLDDATASLAAVLRSRGYDAVAVPATASEDDRPFSHKAAATSAGLGWIGKTALFVSLEFGPAVRLATVFTDLDLPPGDPITEGRCRICRACVDACPAGCGRDVQWRAGMPRDQLFDASACRHQMSRFGGVEPQICGICIAACPLSRTD